jgi:hypothetical protein
MVWAVLDVKAQRCVITARCTALRESRFWIGTSTDWDAGQMLAEGSATCAENSWARCLLAHWLLASSRTEAKLGIGSAVQGPCGISAAATWHELE